MDPQQVELLGPHMRNFTDQLTIGLRQLQEHLMRVYGDHVKSNAPLRPKKSFLYHGGTDPLDYIYIFKNPGNSNEGIPRHWHYIGFGLSDINGYSVFSRIHQQLRDQHPAYAASSQPMRVVYPQPPPGVSMSGFGFELTMRVKCNSIEEWNAQPPEWPSRIMQDLARYVFQSMNIFSVGDHVAWHSPLDSDDEHQESSQIEHILLTLDPQLGTVTTDLGQVKFIQIVGVFSEELQAAREWNVRGILEMMREREDTGGPFLVTDMRRGHTLFELDPDKRDRLEQSIKQMGSDMAQISAKHKTSYRLPDWFLKVEKFTRNLRAEQADGECSEMSHKPDIDSNHITANYRYKEEMAQEQFKRDVEDDYPARPPSRMSLGSESALNIENVALYDVRYYDNIYILLSYESAKVLPVMLNGRLAHRRHFSFQSFRGDSTVTFQPEGSPVKSLVSPEQPFAKQGHWLQIYVPQALREQMYETIKEDFNHPPGDAQHLNIPKNYSWPEFNLHLTVIDEIADD